MEKIATDISTSENLRRGGYTYVDKTDLLWRLVADMEGRQSFIPRPRRFGKSLMLSTLLLRIRKILHDFYIELKNHEGDIRFLMLMGVTKLTKVSVFSGLNRLTDLTMETPEYATLPGYTPEEIAASFPGRIGELAKKLKTNRKETLERLLDWYDSYRFSPGAEARVCNPIAIGKALVAMSIQNCRAKTASASLVMERIAAAGKTPADFDGCSATVDELDVCDVWVFEFKFNKTANAAVRQIREKGYADQYKGDKRPVTLVGVNFRAAKRNIDEPVFAKFKEIKK